MIPERIALTGFLSYEGEQELFFDGAPLWLLSGPNGSGKSSVFDGITFCLFGGARCGKEDYHELINQRCDAGAVEFDFLLDGRRYRIRRTLKRNKRGGATTTQQVFCQQAQGLQPLGVPIPGAWQAVADTTKRIDFDRWVQENIGLTYDTFTASVLLVQGRAENLLGASPRDRHQVLAGIIGMDRFVKLHGRAVEKRNALNAQADTLQKQLDGLPEVVEEEVQEAEQWIATAEADLHTAQEEVERLQGREALARRWADLQDILGRVNKQAMQAQGLLDRQPDIERDWTRLQELHTALPLLKKAVEQRGLYTAAEQSIARLEHDQQRLTAQVGVIDHTLDQVRQKQQQQTRAIAVEEQRRQDLTGQLQSLALALPQLRAVQKARERLRQARSESEAAAAEERQAVELVRQRQQELDVLQEQLGPAIREREQADHRRTRQETLRDEVRARRERFFSVVGDKMCRYCGQSLTPGHVEQEQTRLEEEQAQAEKDHRAALQEQAARLRVEAQLLAEHGTVTAQRTHGQQQVLACQRRRDKGALDAERSTDACNTAFDELAVPFRLRISPAPPSDWLATSFPTEQDIQTLQREHSGLESEGQALARSLRERRQQVELDHAEEARLQTERDAVRPALERLGKETIQQEVQRTRGQEAFAAAVSGLAESWRAPARDASVAGLRRWQNELDTLHRNGAESKYRELEHARLTLEDLQRQRQEVEKQLEAIPAEARCRSEEVRRLLGDARQRGKLCTEKLVEARGSRQRLLDRRLQRDALLQERSRVAREHELHRLLAQYLDRDWLQRHVMRQAEQTIVVFAREIVERLSGGQLGLQQRGDDSGGDKALVLEAYQRTATGTHAHPVEMLSGSERFRVAVSLALAIGQYASRQHRPIQSVIIDEGFGCLDPTNRQLMIQELHNLQGQLHRILLVSHQEEFADAFTNGYRFRLEGGATRVQRFP